MILMERVDHSEEQVLNISRERDENFKNKSKEKC
jgi:hypothetical protein